MCDRVFLNFGMLADVRLSFNSEEDETPECFFLGFFLQWGTTKTQRSLPK